MTHLENEIAQQPDVVARLLRREAPTVRAIADAIRAFEPVFVCIAARGTSDNAARYAQYLFGIHAGLPVALATPSVHTLYDASPNMSRALVIGISQSGQSDDVRRVVSDARAQGALTVSITNDASSPLAQSTHYHLALEAEPELSVAATKTYTAELAAIAMLGAALATDTTLTAQLERLPALMQATLDLSAEMPAWVQRYRYMEKFAVLGRGYNYATTFEIALKIKELCYIAGEEYSEADFRHGPIAMIQPGFPAIVVAPSGKTFPLMLDLLERLHEHKAECLVITSERQCEAHAHQLLMLPEGVEEWLSPLVAVIPGQLFAMHLALARGHEVDQPRNIRKVTITT